MNERGEFATLSGMESVGDRIKELRRVFGLTQERLADAMGVTRGAVGNWELGKGVSPENLQALATRYSVSLDWLMAGQGPGPEGAPEQPPQPNTFGLPQPAILTRSIPVYGQAVAGDDGYFIFNGQKIADLLAPPSLAAVRDAYAVLVSGESMEPRYFAGEAVYVNPYIPVRRGDFVVAQVVNGEDPIPRGYVKQYVRKSEAELVLGQLNPAKEMRFPAERVKSVHKIVFSGEGL